MKAVMKAQLALVIFILSASLAAAQDQMAEQLRNAILEEEVNQSLEKAIQAYQSIMSQFDEQRKIAATALFHLADCYRKQGKSEQAIAAYRRVIREFSDQTKLAEASGSYLTKNYGLSQEMVSAERAIQVRESQARREYRRLLLEEIALIEGQIKSAEKRVEIGLMSRTGPEMVSLQRQLLDLRRTMAVFEAGGLPIPSDPIKK